MIIKNIALAGHAGTGKTTLLEALLYQGGCVERMGSVAAGTTVSDAAPEEIKRHSSVYTATGSIMLDGQKINLLDTPGMFDFAGGMVQGISAADCVMITVSGKSVRCWLEKSSTRPARNPPCSRSHPRSICWWIFRQNCRPGKVLDMHAGPRFLT